MLCKYRDCSFGRKITKRKKGWKAELRPNQEAVLLFTFDGAAKNPKAILVEKVGTVGKVGRCKGCCLKTGFSTPHLWMNG